MSCPICSHPLEDFDNVKGCHRNCYLGVHGEVDEAKVVVFEKVIAKPKKKTSCNSTTTRIF